MVDLRWHEQICLAPSVKVIVTIVAIIFILSCHICWYWKIGHVMYVGIRQQSVGAYIYIYIHLLHWVLIHRKSQKHLIYIYIYHVIHIYDIWIKSDYVYVDYDTMMADVSFRSLYMTAHGPCGFHWNTFLSRNLLRFFLFIWSAGSLMLSKDWGALHLVEEFPGLTTLFIFWHSWSWLSMAIRVQKPCTKKS